MPKEIDLIPHLKSHTIPSGLHLATLLSKPSELPTVESALFMQAAQLNRQLITFQKELFDKEKASPNNVFQETKRVTAAQEAIDRFIISTLVSFALQKISPSHIQLHLPNIKFQTILPISEIPLVLRFINPADSEQLPVDLISNPRNLSTHLAKIFGYEKEDINACHVMDVIGFAQIPVKKDYEETNDEFVLRAALELINIKNTLQKVIDPSMRTRLILYRTLLWKNLLAIWANGNKELQDSCIKVSGLGEYFTYRGNRPHFTNIDKIILELTCSRKITYSTVNLKELRDSGNTQAIAEIINQLRIARENHEIVSKFIF